MIKLKNLLSEIKSAKNFKTGDKIKYLFNGKVYSGEITDHFGDGVMVKLTKPLRYSADNKNINNPMGHNTDLRTTTFELYDGETNPWGSIQMLKK